MPYVNAKNAQLFYTDWGTGKPVVLVHGWCINSDSWEYVIGPLIESGLRCIAYDQRGCGRSDQPWTGHDYDTLADDLAALLGQLNVQDATLVGHSMGGGIITRYLARHGSARVAGAVLIATTTPFALKTHDNPEGVAKASFDTMVEAIKQDRLAYVASLVPGFFGSHTPCYKASPALMQWGINLTLQASAQAAIEMLRANAETDQRDELKTLTTSILLLHGDADLSCPVDTTAKRTHQLLPNSQLKIYEGVAHGLYITHAADVCRDIIGFANRHD